MHTLLKTLSVALVATAVTMSPARAQTLDFETPGLGASDYPAIGTVGGLTFNGFWGLNATLFSASYGANYKAISGSGIAWGRGTASITSTTNFFLNYLYFGTGWYQTTPITLKGKLAGSEVWSASLSPSNAGPELFQTVGNIAIDELTFETSGHEFYIDDLTLASPTARGLADVTATPEPVTLTLLGSGLAGIGGVGALKRRRKTQAS